MFRFAMTVIGLLAFASTAQACINTSATDHTGRKFSPAWYIGEELAESMTWQRADIERRAATIIQTARVKPGYDSWTDLGALLIFQKQYAMAVRHFLMLEKRYPGQYKTAANLGTALELSGTMRPRSHGSALASSAIATPTTAPSGCMRASWKPNSRRRATPTTFRRIPSPDSRSPLPPCRRFPRCRAATTARNWRRGTSTRR